LAFLAPATTTPERGCDNVVLTSRAVVPTTKPLTKALELLFTTPSTETGTNYVLNTADTLQFDRASVVNGEARIYLSGALTGINGVCDEPRVQSQLEETALQFETVNSVQLFLNGQAIDKLSDSEGLQG